jgi:hypothetical protein
MAIFLMLTSREIQQPRRAQSARAAAGVAYFGRELDAALTSGHGLKRGGGPPSWAEGCALTPRAARA